jgi:3',5'-cyclic AMP phosphodiesterase CpdA
MPLHVIPNRRQFLASAAAAAGCFALPGLSRGEDAKSNVATLALLADTHIAADKEAILRDVKMAEHLAKVWDEVREVKPAAALLHGDVAMLEGKSGDYKTVADLLVPGGQAALPLHFMMGNHDDRGPFRSVLQDQAASPIESKHVALLDIGAANWLMLDSLDGVNKTPGKLGGDQLAWLTKALDEHADKPAIISVHHNPVWPSNDPNFKNGGLTDTVALFDVIQPRKHVKAVFFGHTHNWSLSQREGVHLVNLPPVAYVFGKGRPSGWVRADVSGTGLKLTLSALDKQHPQHGEQHELLWR